MRKKKGTPSVSVPGTDRNLAEAIAARTEPQVCGKHGIIAAPWAMAGQQPKRLTLMGPPFSRSKQRKLGIAELKVGIGYQKRPCSRCQKHLWLGPKQLGVLEVSSETKVVCMLCILPELKAGLKDGSVVLTHLGGRGAGCHYTDGRYIGPPEETRN